MLYKFTMKCYLLLTLALICNIAIAQNGQLEIKLENSLPENSLDSLVLNDPIRIELYKNELSVYSSFVLPGNAVTIVDLTPGYYRLAYGRLGFRYQGIDSIQINSGDRKIIEQFYPGPCRFRYKDNLSKPVCINGHKDHIVRIVYGFPNNKLLKKAKAGKIHLGGCVTTSCDPKYFCKLHKREL